MIRILPLGIFFAFAQAPAGDPQAIFDRAVSDFYAARISESVAGFDKVAQLVPSQAPHLWQRGIALYYAGRYGDCRKQFESHRRVNPADVENAAWHFLCVARAESPEKAKAALLPVGEDARVPMREIYRMFQGDLTPAGVLAAAGSQPEAVFYANLYVGLYYEAIGDRARALGYMRMAANEKYSMGGYMHRVAGVHLQVSQPASEVWTFDRLDRIGRHTTTILGQPRVIDSPQGKAIEFDGVDDAIFLDVHPLAGAEQFTWEVVFRPDRDGRPEQRFFHFQENDTQNRLLFETRLVGDNWYLDSFANSGASSRALMDRNLVHPLGRWYHVAMVYDGREFRNYVDGKLQGAGVVSLAPQGAGRTSIGVRINKVDYFKGAIRTARMTRRALAPAEFLQVR